MPEYTRVTSLTVTHTSAGADWETVTEFDGDPVLYALGITIINDEAADTLERRYGTTGGGLEIAPDDRCWAEPIPPECELVINAATPLQLKFAGGAGKVARVVAFMKP